MILRVSYGYDMETIRKLPGLISVLITAARTIPPRNALTAFGVWLIIFALRKIKIRRRRPAIAFEDEEETFSPEDDEETLSLADDDEEETLSPEAEKGLIGEDLIADILYETVPGEFQVFRNLYVPYKDATTELDIVMVHETGIFVFESKNYRGWIYGSMGDLNWTQMFPNRRTRPFYNPVRQNRNHIKALSQYLDIPSRFFRSCIVFSDECELRKVPETSALTLITQTSDLEERLQDKISSLPLAFHPEEIRVISERLLPLTDADSSVKEKHIERIRDALEAEICPFCGAELVIRRGKYGEFWGCSNYPQCNFKRNAT